ncbi:MAG: hypothetical protein KDC38_20225 [Planctomycetes bacterium]|nr:hypothetical protein [Planctomycetota bacterium]
MTTRTSPRHVCRAALGILTPERVSELAIRLGVDPGGKSDAVRQRITRSRRINEQRLLDFLSVYELSDLCRSLGLEHHGTDATTFRTRILGRSDIAATSNRPIGPTPVLIPKDLAEEARAKRARYRKNRLIRSVRHYWRAALWASAGAAIAFGLTALLTDDMQMRAKFAGLGFVATLIIRARRWGRFGGLFGYGIPMIAATYYGFHEGWFELEMATHSRLSLVWAISIVTGAFFGIAEEISGDLH